MSAARNCVRQPLAASAIVRVIHAGIQDHEMWRIPSADSAEPALTTRAGNELTQNIVSSVSLRATFVNRVDDKIGRQR